MHINKKKTHPKAYNVIRKWIRELLRRSVTSNKMFATHHHGPGHFFYGELWTLAGSYPSRGKKITKIPWFYLLYLTYRNFT